MIKQTICALTIGMVLGCSYGSQDKEKNPEVITGIPIGVSLFSGHGYGGLSVVLQTEKGKILAYNDSFPYREFSDAEALILAEMADGDNETITLVGEYQGTDKFYFEKLEVERYIVGDI